jgi:regulator of sirC expression with transglutaminase-like and TPR domain
MGDARRERRALERMNRKAAKPAESVAQSATAPVSKSLPLWTAGIFLGGMVLGIGIAFWMAGDKMPAEAVPPAVAVYTDGNGPPLTMGRLAELSESELAGVDIALMNLLCAEGLPGHGASTVQDCLKKLEQMVQAVRSETAKNLHQFTSNPAEFENSEEFFRVLMLNTVLGQDFGLHYNPKKIAAPTAESLRDQSFYEQADDVFLSGLLGEHRMGTCTSMPVLLVAVGRRLGYPLKLVPAKGHLFLRWDDGKTRRNFECTNGITCYADAHYQKWPFPISDEEVKQGWYLRSLSPREELAAFFALRGQVLQFHRRSIEALMAHAQATLLHPGHPDYRTGLAIASSQYGGAMGMMPAMQLPSTPRFDDPLSNFGGVEAFNEQNQRRMSAPQAQNPVFRQNPPVSRKFTR